MKAEEIVEDPVDYKKRFGLVLGVALILLAGLTLYQHVQQQEDNRLRQDCQERFGEALYIEYENQCLNYTEYEKPAYLTVATNNRITTEGVSNSIGLNYTPTSYLLDRMEGEGLLLEVNPGLFQSNYWTVNKAKNWTGEVR